MARHPQFAQGRHDERIWQGFLAMRPCLHTGCPTLVAKGRCPTHRTTEEQRGYGRDWRRIRKGVIEAQPWCSRCGATSDLVADHVISGDPSRLQTLCRSCNSKKVHHG